MVVNGAFLERLVLAALRLGGDAATEHVELRTMFEVGEPYMTVYDALLKSMHIQRVKSSCLRVGSNLGSPTALSATATEHGYIGLH